MTMQQLKNINKTDKHIHTHKKDIQKLSVVPQDSKNLTERKKTATKTSNMFKIVPRIETCDAGFSSSKFRSSCLPFVVKQTTLPVFSQLLLSRTTVELNFFHGPIEFEITRVNCQCLKWTVAQSPNILIGRPKAAPNQVVTGPTKNVWAIA